MSLLGLHTFYSALLNGDPDAPLIMIYLMIINGIIYLINLQVMKKKQVINGEARGIQRRVETQGQGLRNIEIITFRVERYDQAGNRLSPIPVQMRARSFDGILHDGDWVEIKAKWKSGKTIKVSKLHNLTLNTTLKAKGLNGVAYWIFWIVVTAVLFFIMTA